VTYWSVFRDLSPNPGRMWWTLIAPRQPYVPGIDEFVSIRRVVRCVSHKCTTSAAECARFSGKLGPGKKKKIVIQKALWLIWLSRERVAAERERQVC